MKNLIYRAVSLCLVLCTALSLAVTSSAASLALKIGQPVDLTATSVGMMAPVLQDGVYYLYSMSRTTGLNAQFARGDGANIVIDTIDGEQNETWVLKNIGFQGYITLSPWHAKNTYLSGEKGFDQNLILRKGGVLDQRCHWLPIDQGGGKYVFKNRATGYVIDCAYGDNTRIGNRYLTYEQNGFEGAQSIYPVCISTYTDRLTPGSRVTNLISANYKIALYNDKNKVINDQYDRGVGGRIVSDGWNNEKNEIVRIENRGGGLYSLSFVSQSGLCIAPPDIFTDSQLQLRKYDGSRACLWEIYKVGSTYCFRNAATGLMMDDYCCQTKNGTPIISYSYNGCNAQQFYLTGLITANTGISFIRPTSGSITSRYGRRPSMGDFHTGVDFGAPTGTAIKASAGGKVSFAGTKGNYGLLVIIDHADGYQTYYAHCSKLLVSKNQQVGQGDIIAQVGSTGRSTGPHLHFEIRQNGKHMDPLTKLK